MTPEKGLDEGDTGDAVARSRLTAIPSQDFSLPDRCSHK